MELPEGYYTDIGQRGVKLSGDKSKDLVLPSISKNPPILIFDEQLHLDNESEKVVQESLENLRKT